MSVRAAAFVAVAIAVAGCTGGAPPVADDVVVPEGWRVEVVSDQLDGPTQVIVGPDDRLWVAELHGDEDAGTGRVVALDEGGAPEVLVDGLTTPTGITLAGGFLWVMQEDSLGRAPLDGGQITGEVQVVLDDLPNNGRSETSLSHTADGRVVFGVTGTERDVEDSGQLTVLDPATDRPEVVATGLKNPYAQVAVDDGWVVTEVGDGTFDGGPPRDELVALRRGDDAGWPGCTGDRDPSEDRGVSATDCADTVAPLATFAARATPTGLAALPDGDWLVALWARGELVRVPVQGGEPTAWASGLAGPQHLLARDGDLLLTEHRAGRLLRFVAP